MPLFKSKSDKAVGKNIKAEMAAGKPQKQSIAIALSVQRKAKGKKMAEGGEVEDADDKAGVSVAQEIMARKRGEEPSLEEMNEDAAEWIEERVPRPRRSRRPGSPHRPPAWHFPATEKVR